MSSRPRAGRRDRAADGTHRCADPRNARGAAARAEAPAARRAHAERAELQQPRLAGARPAVPGRARLPAGLDPARRPTGRRRARPRRRPGTRRRPTKGGCPVPDVIDLRSDAIAHPTSGMREAMAFAAVGDEQKREDPSVLALERRTAELLGHEDAVFVPSATM